MTMTRARGTRCQCFSASALGAMLVASGAVALAAEPTPAGKMSRSRVGAYSVDTTGAGSAIVRLYGEPVAEYTVDRANKPFLWRLAGPTGKPMTRSWPMAEVPGEATDHVHQRGLTFGHQGIGGFDVWSEPATFLGHPRLADRLPTVGAIRHRGYRALAGGPTAVVHAHSDIVDSASKPLLAEERRMTFSFGPSLRMIDVDIDLIAAYGPIDMADMKDAGFFIRVPDSMTVDRGLGGTIINSAGQRDADAWSRKATWVDYHGPVAGEHLGIAILNHPTSFRHPTAWHVRTYGLFCANPFGTRQMNPEAESGAVSLAAGERISLRHRVVFHVGDERHAGIAGLYEAYAAETPAPLTSGTGTAPVVSVFSSEGFTGGIEGPACDRAGNLYCVGYRDARTIARVTPDGRAEAFVTLPEGSKGNGIRFAPDGAMFVADYAGHNVLRVDPATRAVTVFAHDDRMSQPNDLAMAPDGTLYASDPDWKNETGRVWRIDREGKPHVAAADLGTTNGIEVSPDGRRLYVNESAQRNIWAFDIAADGSLSGKRLVATFPDHGFDGMRCAADGTLYCTRHGKGTVVVVSPEGRVLEEIDVLGLQPTNLTFGGPDRQTVFVTEAANKRIVSFRTPRAGRE